jgi:uracil phosphoribosyltransferase
LSLTSTETLFLGDILQEAVRQLQPGVKVGKILIQRDESTIDKTPVLFYKKLPRDIADCFVILVDPMLATAGINYIRTSVHCFCDLR